MTHDPATLLASLSADQIETLRYVHARFSSKEIARILKVSPHTVDERVRKILRKLRVSSRVEAARMAASYGIFKDVTPYQSLTYQTVTLADMPEAIEVWAGLSEKDQDRHKLIGMQNSQPKRSWAGHVKRWIFWPMLIVGISIIAFAAINLMLLSLGRSLS